MIINWFASAGLFLEPVSSSSLFTRIMTWFADATNGITKFYYVPRRSKRQRPGR
jgi:hypothetical protein